MKLSTKAFLITVVLSVFLSFNVFAMPENRNEYASPSPSTEIKHEDRSFDYRWTWLSDELCVRFKTLETARRELLEKQCNSGMNPVWVDYTSEKVKIKTRDTYTGKWSQDTEGIWSFVFGDQTIPVGVTKIDNVLYAFNTFGELKAGYEYYDGFVTAGDGLVATDNAELNKWLETQYLPDCTSHE